MDGFNVETGIFLKNVYPTHGFGVIDFLDESNFDQFVDLIRGENGNEAYDVLDDCLAGGQLFSPTPAIELSNFDVTTNYQVPDTEFAENLVEDMAEEDGSSGGTTISTPKKSKGAKLDRSRSLVSERKRRCRMKDKLYALRSLVPNITKMDKASIVGDAALYVQDLQMQATKLKAEIAGLESTFTVGGRYETSNKPNLASFYHTIKKIFKMEVIQVDKREFYVRIESNKGKTIAASLYKAIESLTSFNVQNSNLIASGENYTFIFTLQILEPTMDMSLSNLKLWISSAFLNQGFDFNTPSFF